MWEVEPHMELLSERISDEAYLSANPGEKYTLYFTDGGSIGLDLKKESGKTFKLKWIDISTGEWGDEINVTGGNIVNISAPSNPRPISLKNFLITINIHEQNNLL